MQSAPPLGIKFLFNDDSDLNSSEDEDYEILENEGSISDFEIIPNKKIIKIREFTFHTHNANFVWKGNQEFAQWILDNKSLLENKKIIEFASATGILSIFLKQEGLNITSSDYNDPLIVENIRYNASLNGLNPDDIPHIPYNWGDPISDDFPIFDIVIANDILVYQSAYQKLAQSLRDICLRHPQRGFNGVHFYLGHKRRLKANPTFFQVMESYNFTYKRVASYIYDFYLNE